MKKTGILLLVMMISLLVVMPTPAPALTVWNLNTDLAANAGWNTAFPPGPVVGNWSMGWTKTVGKITVFDTLAAAANTVWHHPLDDPFKAGSGGNPDGSTTPHGAFSDSQKCILAPANYVYPDDPNTYSVYSQVLWTSPATLSQAAISGTVYQSLGSKVDVLIVKIDAALMADPELDPAGHVETLYSYIDDNGPSAKEFSILTSVQINEGIALLIIRNQTENGDNSGASQIDFAIADDPCAAQNKYNPADINHDCYVDFNDLMIIIASWLDCNDPQYPANCPVATN